MKNLFVVITLVVLGSISYATPPTQTCGAMDEAANALTKINGGTFAAPSYRLPEMPVMTDQGAEFSYQFDAFLSRNDDEPNQPSDKIGTIETKALIKKGETACKVLSLIYQPL